MNRYVDLCQTFAESIPYAPQAKTFVVECGAYIARIDSLAGDYHFNIFNTHGEKHSRTVTGLCSAFLDIIPLFALAPMERRVLFLAGYCHDLGMVTGDRRSHARQTQELLADMWQQLGLLSGSEASVVGWVAAMHSSRTDHDRVPDTVMVEHPDGQTPVRVKLLGAVLRICDALHCTRDRIPPLEVQQHLGILPETQIREYHKHYLFENVTLSCDRQQIAIHLEGQLRHDIPNVRGVLSDVCTHLKEEIAGVAYLFAPHYALKETDGRPFSYAITLSETTAPLIEPSPAGFRSTSSEVLRSFVGRTAYINDLDRWVATTTPPILVIGGIGGIGKTALLQQIGLRHAGRCVYLAASRIGSSREDLLEELLTTLPPSKRGAVDEFLSNRLLDVSAGGRLDACARLIGDLRITVCIDDYHDVESDDIDATVIGLAQRCRHLGFLLASRRVPQFAHDPKCAVRVVPLNGMDLDETRGLLDMLGLPANLLAEQRAVQTIWERAGHGHPLAVVIFANLLGQTSSKTLAEVLELLPDYTDEVWARWIDQLLGTLDGNERRILDALSVMRVPVSVATLAGVVHLVDLEAGVKSLQRRFLVQRLPNRRMALHPLLSAQLYDHIPDEARRHLHSLAASYFVPPDTDKARHRILPLESYEMAFHHAHMARESERMVALAQNMLGDLLLQGRTEKAERVCGLVEGLVGRDRRASWFLIRKARLLSLKGDHRGCQQLLNRVEADGATGTIAGEALQIRALDFIRQGRGSHAFDLLKTQFRTVRNRKITARLAITAIRCLPTESSPRDVLAHLAGCGKTTVNNHEIDFRSAETG